MFGKNSLLGMIFGYIWLFVVGFYAEYPRFAFGATMVFVTTILRATSTGSMDDSLIVFFVLLGVWIVTSAITDFFSWLHSLRDERIAEV